MPRGILSNEDIKMLIGNPNVIYIEGNRIIYSPVFKKHFIEEYQRGKRPGIIFKEAGLDPKILGNKRIERASERWRKNYATGALSAYENSYLRHQDEKQKLKAKHKETEKTTKKLMQQIQHLEETLAEKDKQIIELRNRLRVYCEI